MIERWFPCTEVSANSGSGWGSGNAEVQLFPWFAKRPIAQAKAAVICSLLPWPDDEAEQKRLQALVRRAMADRYGAWEELHREIDAACEDGPKLLDPFSGRGILPLEAAKLDLTAYGIDYSPVAVLASHLLTDFPFRDWSQEPVITFDDKSLNPTLLGAPISGSHLPEDVRTVVDEVGARFEASMQEFLPVVNGRQPWAYLWAVTLPCTECGRRFPLVGAYELRPASTRKGKKGSAAIHDPGQSFYIEADRDSGQWQVIVHSGSPRRTPTRQVAAGKSRYDASGKIAVCPFCGHAHTKDTHTRMAEQGLGQDEILLAADVDPVVGKSYRQVSDEERESIEAARAALASEANFTPLLPARPNELIPAGNTWTVQATVYGAKTYGDMMNDRQTLGFIRLARAINEVAVDVRAQGASEDYTRALTAYAAAVMARKIRRATRGATLAVSRQGVSDVFQTESSLNYSYDYLEIGLGDGPGTWRSVADGTLNALASVQPSSHGAQPVDVRHGSATELPFGDATFQSVVTDPPYEAMIDYSDASDLFYVWLKRALANTWPELGVTSHEGGVQEKDKEIIVKKGGTTVSDPRDRDHYDRLITQAFAEAQRVVRPDGVVTIVFGHGEPEVWRRLLTSIQSAGLILTGSWPAKTEQGGKSGFSNIVTTLTMACRPATSDRPIGLKAQVQSEIKAAIKTRIDLWESSGLAPTDMLMAAAGPAMEVVGKYSHVMDINGNPLDPMGYPVGTDLTFSRQGFKVGERPPQGYLEWARQAVQEHVAVEIDHHPLDTFDARTRFALWWVQLFGKGLTADSELRWQTMVAELDERAVNGIVARTKKGARFADASMTKWKTSQESAVIDVAMAMAAVWTDGLDAVGKVLADSGRDDDPYLWATIAFLSGRLPESDPDAMAWTGLIRNRRGVSAAAKGQAQLIFSGDGAQ